MNKIITICVLCVVVFSCSHKTTSTITATEKTENASVSNEQFLAGKAIYTAKCGKCHKLYEPSRGNMTQWEEWIDKMAPKAKLTAEETEQVSAYVSVNAKSN